ncbi:MAG: type I-E CRISPR-associated protein Cas7/Cse4/CasC [Desulfovibrionaceae bacterium]|nr:type I-E CRISPR-associated protein Cas7/Cse4/CasC [Desulfovibrionaceae bacterium]
MRHLELHILQSIPVACLNRDDFGSPKTAIFGNVPRARVSSQCWKRAIREEMAEEDSAHFSGCRTRLVIDLLQKQLKLIDFSEDEAKIGAEKLGDVIGKLDNPPTRVKTVFFTSPSEIKTLAEAYKKAKDAKKALKALGKVLPHDAADIALFGRMVASDHSLTVEGAAMFSHAISTHRVSNELDFFAAVDDLKSEDSDDAGAAMTGTLEFNSATYYRFAALNLDMLADEKHLGSLTLDERKAVVQTFVKATLTAVPAARHNSMHAATLPSFVLAIVREKGHPIQLANAYEIPVWSPKNGLVEESRKKLEAEYSQIKETWGISALTECRIPDMSLAALLEEVGKHVC